MEAKKLHERIIGLRTYVAIGLVVAATTHHLGMGAVPIEYHLTTEIFVYGICAPAAAWLLLGWLARSALRSRTSAPSYLPFQTFNAPA